jgi:flagellar motor protein MotB
MAKKQKAQGVPFGAFAAITMYADLLSLLLTLFVVLFAISEPKRPAMAAASAAARQVMSNQPPAPPPKQTVRPQRTTMDELGVLRRGPPGRTTEVQSISEDGRQKLVLGGEEFFARGSSALSPNARQVLQTYIAPDMRGFHNRIEITGHAATDEGEGVVDPWALGSARATAVMRYLVDECGLEQNRFRIISDGDRVPQDTQNPAANRRVDVIMTDLGMK